MLAVGSKQIRSVHVGGKAVTQIRIGSKLIWSASQQADNFNRETLGDLWVPTGGTAPDRAPIIVNGSVRLNIPSGLISEATRVGGVRFVGATATGPDGWLEFQAATRGADVGHLSTYVCDHAPATENLTHFLAVELCASQLYLTRRLPSGTQRVAECGVYQPGDIMRMVTNGNVYSLYRQGKFVGVFEDNGNTVVKGDLYRSMAMLFSGDKGFFGPRRFSAAIDNIEHS